MTDTDRVIRLPEVIKIVQLSKSTIYEMMRRGEFPKPILLGTRARGWLFSDIQDFISTKSQSVQLRQIK